MKNRNQDDQTYQNVDHPSVGARGTKRRTEDEGEREESKRQDSMIMSCLRDEAVMTRGRYYLGSVEENEDKNTNMAMDVPTEEDNEAGAGRSLG